jgi:hypothetical protein
MSGRHVLAVTNSAHVAKVILATALADFPDAEQRLAFVEGQGWCTEIVCDEDDFVRWLQPTSVVWCDSAASEVTP